MIRTITILLALLLAAGPAACAIHVPDDFSGIGDALLAASPYDTILVAPGTYYVNLEWPATPGIKLIGQAGALETILDGQDNVQVIGIYSGVDTTTVIHGFRIHNGHAEGQ
jgi:hypothetical protein